jgi:ArsR family transcriptional regulator
VKLIQKLEDCCPVVAPKAMRSSEAERLASAFKVLGDPARLRMLSLIAACEEGEMCVCDLTTPLGVGQPTVSHHLKVLHDAGFLRREKRGTWVYYAIERGALDVLRAALEVRAPAARR